ncbi:MAG: c-type cytochrome [Candidatus Rokubacteria bacterium]|nr:c-type cytochrome [Candidatus Rokubacteria bacterium]
MNGRVGSLAIAAVLALVTLGPAGAQPLFSPTQDPIAGSRVFGEKGCVKCHAVKGVGGKVGPDLGRLPRPRSFFDLAAAMWNHLPRMAERMRRLGIARPRLDARETGDLIAFLFTFDYFDPPGNVPAGRRLFTEKKCVVCHQVGDVGGVIGPNLDFLKQYGSPIFVASAMWNHGPAMAEVMRAKGIQRPTFKDAELLDLIAYAKATSRLPVAGPLYVLPGRASEGHRLFVEKRCSDCHGVAGKGGGVGPDLAERGVHRTLTQFAAAMWNKAPAMVAAMKGRGVPVPQLTAEEMADIVAYLYAVQYFAVPGDRQRGARLANEKGCFGCHGVQARDGKAPADLAQVRGLDSPAAVVAALWNHSFIGAPPTDRPPPRWAEFRPDEMADLVAFLRSLSGGR